MPSEAVASGPFWSLPGVFGAQAWYVLRSRMGEPVTAGPRFWFRMVTQNVPGCAPGMPSITSGLWPASSFKPRGLQITRVDVAERRAGRHFAEEAGDAAFVRVGEFSSHVEKCP